MSQQLQDLKGFTGKVNTSGQITSNGNMSCTKDGNKVYTVSYADVNGNLIPVVSLVTNQPDVSLVLTVYSGGFNVQAFNDISGTPTPIDCAFNFIVASL